MIPCPNCSHQELEGALYCSQCGSQIYQNTDTTVTIPSSDLIKEKEKVVEEPVFPEPPADKSESNVALYLVDADEYIHIDERAEITVGRETEGQMVVPDIDLGPFDAYQAGVSRLHVHLNLSGPQMTIKDLGSSNGTLVNGVKLKPHTNQIIQNGDILTIGNLEIQILVRE